MLAAARQERKARGSERNLLLHLALLGHAVSIGKLGIMKSRQARRTGFRSAMWLNRRAARLGETWVVRNNALNRFNCGDMPGYRWWLHRAARAGDEESGEELRRFETRLPHETAAYVGRQRAHRKHDGMWSNRRLGQLKPKYYPAAPFQSR